MADMGTDSGTNPSWRPIHWETVCSPQWQKVDDFYNQLRGLGCLERYVRQAIGERDQSYADRLAIIDVPDDLKQAIKSNAGLLSEFRVKDESPDVLKTQTNVDRCGNNLEQFVNKVLTLGLKNGCVLMGCHIDLEDSDRTPYFSCLDIPSEVFAPRVGLFEGKRQLTQVSIKSLEEVDIDDADDFSVVEQEVFTVYRLRRDGATVEIYRKQEEGFLGEGERLLTQVDGTPLNQLPFVWLDFDPSAKIGHPAPPPYYSLACKLARLINMVSELDAVQRKTNIPIPTQECATLDVHEESKTMKDLVLGSDHVWLYAKGTSVGFAEPKGTAMSISHARIQDLKEEIKAEKDKYIGLDTPQTATAVSIEAGQTRMSLQTIAVAVESAFEELFKLYQKYSERYKEDAPAGGISIEMQSIKPPPDLQDLQAIITLQEAGVIDEYEARAKAFDIGFMTDSIKSHAEQMRENQELAIVARNLDLATLSQNSLRDLG